MGNSTAQQQQRNKQKKILQWEKRERKVRESERKNKCMNFENSQLQLKCAYSLRFLMNSLRFARPLTLLDDILVWSMQFNDIIHPIRTLSFIWMSHIFKCPLFRYHWLCLTNDNLICLQLEWSCLHFRFHSLLIISFLSLHSADDYM